MEPESIVSEPPQIPYKATQQQYVPWAPNYTGRFVDSRGIKIILPGGIYKRQSSNPFSGRDLDLGRELIDRFSHLILDRKRMASKFLFSKHGREAKVLNLVNDSAIVFS